MIRLNENYSIKKHEVHGFTLLFEEERQREKTKVIDGKKVKTGETETFTFTDAWYFPKLQMALEKFVDLSFCKESSIEYLIYKVNELNETIKGVTYEKA
jgi:hypothetical protein